MRPRATLAQPTVSQFMLMALLCCVSCLIACAPEIGDDCHTSLDCSSSGTRLCDRTQPYGYCTLQGCEEGTCPEEAVCVKFSPGKDRLSTTYCMYKCDDSSDCRDDQGYECLRAMAKGKNPEALSDPNAFGSGIEAEVLGSASQKFCAYRSELPLPVPDAGTNMSMPSEDDGGAVTSGG